MTTMLERAEQWWQEHPDHVHRFRWNPDTDNRHCPCGAWIHYLGGVTEAYEAEL
ncbi:MAG TPA: hypothetical protein VFT87_01130 [Candidatus Saccharimonadales bacterium]|nr:hypothetical protein [Candidatus Saccharimonadales bacterium]